MSNKKYHITIFRKMACNYISCILSENECTRFNQIQKAIPDISPKVLSDTLKNLETDGIIKRIVYGEVPPRVEYSLTKLGLSLMPYINNLEFNL